MLRTGEAVFVDTGAWAALAAEQDALHPRAVLAWNELAASGARLHSSESRWRSVRLKYTHDWAKSSGVHSSIVTAVDATSFVIMNRLGIRAAFSFDHHFASVGFRLVG